MAGTGGINVSKTYLMVLIGEAMVAEGYTAVVYGDWRLGIQQIYNPKTGPKLPLVTVRISPARIVPSFYGRIWESNTGCETGDIGIYAFTAHVFCAPCEDIDAEGNPTCEKYKNAHDLADAIMHHLNTRQWNSVPHSAYPIGDIMDLQARESEPSKGAHKVCRVIIEGTLLIKRTD